MGRRLIISTLTLLSLSISSGAQADAAADIAYRQAVFTVIGGQMKAMGAILKGQVRTEQLAYHAEAMREVSTTVPTLFPAGSGEGKTKALPEIWGEPEDFKMALDRYVSAAADMADAVATNDMSKAGAAMGALGKACKGCHDNFKADD